VDKIQPEGEIRPQDEILSEEESLIQFIESKDAQEPMVLDKYQVKSLLADSGVEEEQLQEFDKHFDEAAGEKAEIYAANIVNPRSFEVKTADVIIKVSPDRADLVETREIDGRPCLVIAIDGGVEVNGIMVKPGNHPETEEE